MPEKDDIKRPAKLTIVSILIWIIGGLGLLTGFLLLLSGTFLTTSLGILGIGVGIFGFLIIVWSIVDIISGYGVWKLRKWGGILALVSAVLSAVVGLFFIASDFGLTLIMNVVIIILIILGWKYLK